MSYRVGAKTKGYIKNLDSGEFMKFQYNPETFNYGRTASFNEVSSPASPYPLISYGKGDLTAISFVVPVFDPLSEGKVEMFLSFMEQFLPRTDTSTFIDSDPKPKEMMLFYGRFSRKCVLKGLHTEYVRYDSDGLPIHVNVSIDLIEIADIYAYGATTRPTIVAPATPDNPDQYDYGQDVVDNGGVEEGDDDYNYDEDKEALPSSKDILIECQAHVQNIGDMASVDSDDEPVITYPDTQPDPFKQKVTINEWVQIGTTGQSLRLEAFRVKVSSSKYNIGIRYMSHIQNKGWEGTFTNGGVGEDSWTGTKGESLRLEAFKLYLSGNDADKFDIEYQAHVQNMGWLDAVRNGRFMGTTGVGLRIEAIRFKIVERQPNSFGEISIGYQSQIENQGWQEYVFDDTVTGTTGEGLRLEALRFYLPKTGDFDLSVSAQAHVENYGWMGRIYFNNDSNQEAYVGTVGEGLRLEALKLRLEGSDKTRFNIYYTSHIENIGTIKTYASNDDPTGTAGSGLRLENIRAYIVPVQNF